MRHTLREAFGFDDFRDGQEQVVHALMEGRSALAVFPTGGGKSICYQLPALLLDGLTLVISPLIALMKDQVDRLVERGIPAARLDSTLDGEEVSRIDGRLERGELKLLYIAPERLANQRFRQRLKRLRIDLVAIDEAHCISAWGHNFRPDYMKLAKVCRALKVPRVLALTATATPQVAADIRKHFGIAREDQVQLSFHRPNLDLSVMPCAAAERKGRLLRLVADEEGAAVVYVTRQETAEEVATWLVKNGISARAYHAGMPDDFRSDAQRAFMAGEARVVVATIAFGMGIDKADIRMVAHYNLPKSLENYTQEIGRAGRDGKAARCVMMACPDDLIVLENFIHADTPSRPATGNLLDRVLRLGASFDISAYDLSVSCDIRQTVVSTLMTYLEMEGLVEAAGTFYANHSFRLMQPLERVLAGRPPAEVKLVRGIITHAEEKKLWSHFVPAEAAEGLGTTREKLVALLGELERAGDIAVKVSGVRQAYVMKRDPGDIPALRERMYALFAEREAADLARLEQVLALSAQPGCLTDHLTSHFGEKLPAPCGHCDRCRGIPPVDIGRPVPRRVTDEELEMIRVLKLERHAALGTPRQLARFLCGMRSPAATRAKLGRHDAFGLLDDLPFSEVLVVAKAA